MKNVTVIMIVIILIVVVAALAVGYVLLSPSEKVPVLQPDLAKNADRDNWKTYTFAAYPFQFRYPASWVLEEVEPGVAAVGMGDGPSDEGLIIVNVTGELPYERAVQEVETQFAEKTITPTRVGDFVGVQIEGTLRADLPEAAGKRAIFTMLDAGGRLVAVDHIVAEGEPEAVTAHYQGIVASLESAVRQSF